MTCHLNIKRLELIFSNVCSDFLVERGRGTKLKIYTQEWQSVTQLLQLEKNEVVYLSRKKLTFRKITRSVN